MLHEYPAPLTWRASPGAGIIQDQEVAVPIGAIVQLGLAPPDGTSMAQPTAGSKEDRCQLVSVLFPM
ncbi:hypothetical protein Y88_2016 [Novosphingobium nitrogenifigens DSM 19370]|uniref:Uncharacterized protein n=1 Tax=Novosphingobium nitrogenifigens DSM 19370 TaxID=983920 RepID=F1Z5N2_9SPHN|nr:hypothetical protein Y88_2016 [Novosphingobium nitrogenifigens DSM 19370]